MSADNAYPIDGAQPRRRTVLHQLLLFRLRNERPDLADLVTAKEKKLESACKEAGIIPKLARIPDNG